MVAVLASKMKNLEGQCKVRPSLNNIYTMGVFGMGKLASEYGHYISAIVQIIMYQIAADALLYQSSLDLAAPLLGLCNFLIVMVPLCISKYCETKYAQTFMKD